MSVKAVLLHIDNKVASVSIAHSVVLKDSYLDMKCLLDALWYNLHQWKICGDLKMICILGYTKYPCLLCLWDSRADDQHYLQKEWLARGTLTPGGCNVKSSSLVDPKNVLLPPLHIKLGLTKNFVKGLNKSNPSFKFPTVSDAKLGAGVFNGPQICESMRDSTFDEVLTEAEKRTRESFKNVFTKFLGKKRRPNYEDMVYELMHNSLAWVRECQLRCIS